MQFVPQGQPFEEVTELLLEIAETNQPNVRYQTTVEMKEYIAGKLVDPTGNDMNKQNLKFINRIVNNIGKE